MVTKFFSFQCYTTLTSPNLELLTALVDEMEAANKYVATSISEYSSHTRFCFRNCRRNRHAPHLPYQISKVNYPSLTIRFADVSRFVHDRRQVLDVIVENHRHLFNQSSLDIANKFFLFSSSLNLLTMKFCLLTRTIGLDMMFLEETEEQFRSDIQNHYFDHMSWAVSAFKEEIGWNDEIDWEAPSFDLPGETIHETNHNAIMKMSSKYRQCLGNQCVASTTAGARTSCEGLIEVIMAIVAQQLNEQSNDNTYEFVEIITRKMNMTWRFNAPVFCDRMKLESVELADFFIETRPSLNWVEAFLFAISFNPKYHITAKHQQTIINFLEVGYRHSSIENIIIIYVLFLYLSLEVTNLDFLCSETMVTHFFSCFVPVSFVGGAHDFEKELEKHFCWMRIHQEPERFEVEPTNPHPLLQSLDFGYEDIGSETACLSWCFSWDCQITRTIRSRLSDNHSIIQFLNRPQPPSYYRRARSL